MRNSKGVSLYPGQPLGAEIAVNGRSGWQGSIGGDGGLGLIFGETFMRFLAFEPQRGRAWRSPEEEAFAESFDRMVIEPMSGEVMNDPRQFAIARFRRAVFEKDQLLVSSSTF